MWNQIDVRALAELEGSGQEILTVYLKSPRALPWFERRCQRLEAMLSEHREAREHFLASQARIRRYLEQEPYTSGGLYLVASHEHDLLEAYRLDLPEDRLAMDNGVWLGKSPYVRPIAELQDEFANYVVILADNHSARVALVTAGRFEEQERLLGEIKNHVKKGGWSQQRYARRRAKQITEYVGEIIEAVERIERRQTVERLLVLGSSEIVIHIEERLPRRMRNHVSRVVEMGAPEQALREHLFELFAQSEREQEQALWAQIEEEYMQQGRALLGASDTHAALAQGRVHALLIQRDTRLPGTRCQACGHVALGVRDLCQLCGEQEPFAIDMINEFVELAAKGGAQIEFSDPNPALAQVEGVAVLLRY